MAECPQHARWIEKLAAGEISASDEAELRGHARECPDCRALLELHEDLLGLGEGIPEPSVAEFRRLRRRVLHASGDRGGGPLRRAWGWRWGFPLRFQPVQVVALVAALVAGAFFGRLGAADAGRIDEARLLAAVQQQAAETSGVDGHWDAPFFYANVSARAVGAGELALSFDVCRHVALVAPRGSALARDVLIQAMLEPTSLGGRLRAIDLAAGSVEGAVRDALFFALHGDPSLAVRLGALELLVRSPYGPQVEEALLTTLREDPAVQMRLEALECLAARQADPEALRRTIGAAGLERNDPVMIRASELIHQL